MTYFRPLDWPHRSFIKVISFSDKYDSASPNPLFHTDIILNINEIIKLQVALFVSESKMRLNPLEFHTFLPVFLKCMAMVHDSLHLKTLSIQKTNNKILSKYNSLFWSYSVELHR